jgi:hypothetical protein
MDRQLAASLAFLVTRAEKNSAIATNTRGNHCRIFSKHQKEFDHENGSYIEAAEIAEKQSSMASLFSV